MLETKYSVIYFLTWDCNLACQYCYEIGKSARNMNWEVARDGVDFFMSKYKRVNFQFFGGEPLLQFNLMEKMAEYLKRNYDERFGLSLFTNGTLISDEVVDFFRENKVFVTLSIDGSKATQDKNRRFKNNQGTFEILEPILQKLIASKVSLRIRMTVTPDNCDKLFDNIKFFVEKYALTDIQEEVDRFTYWNENQIDILIEQYDQIINYLLGFYKSDNSFRWKNYEKRIHPFVNQSWKVQRGRCGSTEGMCSMDVDGTLYPCQKFIVNQTLSIGNIYSGFNEVQRDIVRNYLLPNYLEQTRQCKSCEAVNYCFAGCIADNYLQDTNQLQDCDFRRLHQNMHKKFYDELIRNNIAPKRYDSSIYRNTKGDGNSLVAVYGCGSEGCGAEGSAPAGCGAEGCGAE